MMSAVNNSIHGNIASTGAKVNNIVQHIGTANFSWNPRVLLETFARTNVIDHVLAPEEKVYLDSVGRDMYRANPQAGRSARATYCFLRQPQEMSIFEPEFIHRVTRYPKSRTTKYIMEILNPNDVQSLYNWKNFRGNSILLLHLQGEEIERSEWTTNFTLEAVCCLTQSDRSASGRRTSAVVGHFCASRSSTSRWTQEAIVRDLLAQIHRVRRNHLRNSHNCEAPDPADIIYHREAKSPSELWMLLKHAVVKSGIKTLYVCLDNIDHIHRIVDEATLDRFYYNLRKFLEHSHREGVPVKLLMTSRSSSVAPSLPRYARVALAQPLPYRYKQ